MPNSEQYTQTQRRISQRRPQHSRISDPGIHLAVKEIEEFLEAYQEKGLVKGTIAWYRRGLKRLSQDLPEDKNDTLRYVGALAGGFDSAWICLRYSE